VIRRGTMIRKFSRKTSAFQCISATSLLAANRQRNRIAIWRLRLRRRHGAGSGGGSVSFGRSNGFNVLDKTRTDSTCATHVFCTRAESEGGAAVAQRTTESQWFVRVCCRSPSTPTIGRPPWTLPFLSRKLFEWTGKDPPPQFPQSFGAEIGREPREREKGKPMHRVARQQRGDR